MTMFCSNLAAKANLGNYLMEKYYSEHYQQLSFKYFVKSSFIPKLSLNVSNIQTTISSRHGWFKQYWYNQQRHPKGSGKEARDGKLASGGLCEQMLSEHMVLSVEGDLLEMGNREQV